MKNELLLSMIFLVLCPVFAHAANLEAIYTQHQKSVVTIAGKTKSGTGFYVTEYFIMTNFHVIKGQKDLRFAETFSSGFTNIEDVVAIDAKNDLAILYTDKQGPPVQFADSRKLVPGAELASIGSPRNYEKTIVGGNFSQARQNGLLQVSVPLSPGASGSPIFDKDGLVVGVAKAIRVDSQNLNFAIPSNIAQDLLTTANNLTKNQYVKISNLFGTNNGQKEFNNPTISVSSLEEKINGGFYAWISKKGTYSFTFNKPKEDELDRYISEQEMRDAPISFMWPSSHIPLKNDIH